MESVATVFVSFSVGLASVDRARECDDRLRLDRARRVRRALAGVVRRRQHPPARLCGPVARVDAVHLEVDLRQLEPERRATGRSDRHVRRRQARLNRRRGERVRGRRSHGVDEDRQLERLTRSLQDQDPVGGVRRGASALRRGGRDRDLCRTREVGAAGGPHLHIAGQRQQSAAEIGGRSLRRDGADRLAGRLGQRRRVLLRRVEGELGGRIVRRAHRVVDRDAGDRLRVDDAELRRRVRRERGAGAREREGADEHEHDRADGFVHRFSSPQSGE